jgi:hypothetical protein
MYSASIAISALHPGAYAKILSGYFLIRINRFSLSYGKYYSRNNYASCQFAFERLRNFYRLPTYNIWKKIFPNAIENLCSAKIHQDKFRIRYKFLQKFNICGNSADGVIDVEEDCSIVFTFLFDLIEFFDCSILQSKIVKKCESFAGVKFISNHPSSASLDSCDWGHVTFFYDAKQGDLSLEIKFYQRI